ncbi:MAG: VWA domain-containing protein [Pirellulales bacterium]
MFSAVLMVVMMAMVAFSIDVGYIANVQTDLQRSVDAGALAGAGVLVNGTQVAEQMVMNYIQMNKVATKAVAASDVVIETGTWNETTRAFSPVAQGVVPSAIRVRAQRNNEGLFFAPVIGSNSFDASAEAIAVYQPRDIMLVLDYSASMNDDSELRHISSIGQSNVEANLQQIYGELGSPSFGNMQWDPVYVSSTDTTTIKNTLGLNSVPYPYPSGSWDSFISYVKSSGYVNNAGYRKKYGYLTLVNYWLQSRPKYNQTPDLWQVSEQPITAVKDSVTLFLAYLQEVDTDDRLGLSVYTYSDGTAKLESQLTYDFQSVEDISRQRQAGHYDYYTNIGAGMREARLELENNARLGAFKMIVLMTDGIANRPSDTNTARQYALDEAQLAADSRFPIVTISLGAAADTSLMQQIADITSGAHFNIPGGQAVSSYEEGLRNVFRAIADDRPLKLVK